MSFDIRLVYIFETKSHECSLSSKVPYLNNTLRCNRSYNVELISILHSLCHCQEEKEFIHEDVLQVSSSRKAIAR